MPAVKNCRGGVSVGQTCQELILRRIEKVRNLHFLGLSAKTRSLIIQL
jgi:hypothetical protein